MMLDDAQLDRAAGVVVGQACGDALGVPYEFALSLPTVPEMIGGGLGPYEPGQWSDDTEMAICIARVSARGLDLTSAGAADEVAEAYTAWVEGGAKDVGVHTRAVLFGAAGVRGPARSMGERMRAAALERHAATRHTAGNGALMRTGIVGLTRLMDRDATAGAARAMAELTHPDPLAGDSCVIWSEAVRVAVLDGRLDLVSGLDLIPVDRRALWSGWISDAESGSATLRPNGFTVTALQAAWAAICSAGSADDARHLVVGVNLAVLTGDDTDTIAAIAGALLGARHGLSAVPDRWLEAIHGWPGMRAADLALLGRRTAKAGVLNALWRGSARGGCRRGRHAGRTRR